MFEDANQSYSIIVLRRRIAVRGFRITADTNLFYFGLGACRILVIEMIQLSEIYLTKYFSRGGCKVTYCPLHFIISIMNHVTNGFRGALQEFDDDFLITPTLS